MGRLNHNKLVWVDGTLIAVPDKNEPIINKELIDWVIREEGFLNEPTDIGDGKITLGSGLTDPRWHKLYNERGGKWSSEDNRRAVAEELAKRNKWAEDSIPNWEYFPNDAKRAMLSYKYNYDFTPSNSPKLFNAMSNLDFLEAVRQMDATSKDPKFRKGLEERRARERAWALRGIEDNFFSNKPEEPVEMPDALTVSNPYESRIDNTIFSNRYVPASNSNYVETVPISREADEDAKVDSIVQNIIAYNNLRNKLSWKNQEPQQYVPTSGINYVAPVSYSEGGELKKRKTWDELSMTERAEMMRVAIENGITTLPEIKKQYNEFAEGGDTEVNDYRSGGKIQIRPENRGKFTRLKERTGHSASWFKAHGTPAQRKMAIFALNSRHWKHALGGPLVDAAMAHFYGGETEDSQQMETYDAPWVTEAKEKEALRRAWLDEQAEKYAQAVEDAKHPIGHYMNELVVTPNGTRLGSVSSDAMLDNLQSSIRERQAKDRRDASDMVRHIHEGTEAAAKVLAPLVAAPAAPYLYSGITGLMANPVVNAAFTADGVINAPSRIREGIEDISNGNYGPAAWNLGTTALDLVGGASLLKTLPSKKTSTIKRMTGIDMDGNEYELPIRIMRGGVKDLSGNIISDEELVSNWKRSQDFYKMRLRARGLSQRGHAYTKDDNGAYNVYKNLGFDKSKEDFLSEVEELGGAYADTGDNKYGIILNRLNSTGKSRRGTTNTANVHESAHLMRTPKEAENMEQINWSNLNLDEDEAAARGSQIKSMLGIKDYTPITAEQLKYMKDNYVRLTGQDNNMQRFLDSITDFGLAAGWLSRNSFALGGARNLLKFDFLKHPSGWKGF